MATLDILSGPKGPLTHVLVPLARGEQRERAFYALDAFMDGMARDVPGWNTGRLRATQTPAEQMDDILSRWIAGRRMKYSTRLNDLMPRTDEVWEMKTADLRIFGWIYRPRVFIASFVDYADWYKPPHPCRLYEDAGRRVKADRDAIDLDPPKFTGGTYDALV